MLSIQISLKLTATFSFKILKILNMLEKTEAHSAPHKPLCVCACICGHTHLEEKTANTQEGAFYFSERELLCKHHTWLLLWNFRFLIVTFTHRPLQWCSHLHTDGQGNNTLLDCFLGFRAPSGIQLLVGFSFVLSSCSTSQSTISLPYVLSTV